MNMNRGISALINSHHPNPFHISVSFFHSTPILERRRRQWDPSVNYHYQKKRFRRFNAKQTLLRNVSAFAEDFFQNLHHESDQHDSSSSQGSSWFQRDFRSYAPNSSRLRNKGHRKWRRFDFTEDLDFEVESFFRTGFGGNYYYTWFVNEDPQQRRSSRYSNNYRHSKWRFTDEEDYDDESTESDMYESDLKSERLALGLNPSGPLNLEDVKNAYRSCALKWHPDRHHGPSKKRNSRSAVLLTNCCVIKWLLTNHLLDSGAHEYWRLSAWHFEALHDAAAIVFSIAGILALEEKLKA